MQPHNTTHDPAIKLCECGCGQPAPISKRSNSSKGHIKGQPVRFISGHQAKVRQIRPTLERFWEKVDKRGPDDCWEWRASDDGNGYGAFWDGERVTKAHRYSYSLAHGPIPEGLDCLHRCDNPPCCNPAHLFIGDAATNIADAIAKGRFIMPPPNQVEGETNGRAQYTPAQVREFRRLFDECETSIYAFAISHGVPLTSMWRIINRITYKNA